MSSCIIESIKGVEENDKIQGLAEYLMSLISITYEPFIYHLTLKSDFDEDFILKRDSSAIRKCDAVKKSHCI